MDINELIASEDLQIKRLEELVQNSLNEEKMLTSKLLELEENSKLTLGQKLADKVADFGGSWTFIIAFGVFLLIWILLNIYWLMNRAFDPYPFIFLNLILSCLAALQAPIIMMSQNRQEAKDRIRSKYDYKVNLKAELEIRQIHEKLDHLLSKQWERLAEIQEIQIEQLSELSELKKRV